MTRKKPSLSPKPEGVAPLEAVIAELAPELEALAEESKQTPEEVLRKAVHLISLSVKARGRGERLEFVDQHGRVVSKLLGL